MAVTDAYATAAEYRAELSKSTTTDDAQILVGLTAISRYIDKRLGRFFTKDASDVARVYMPRSTGVPVRNDWAESENPWRYGGLARQLYIDDLSAAPTTIKIDQDRDGVFSDETALASTEYELLPRNADKGSEPMPFTCIELTAWGSTNYFPTGCRVEVTGKFGWPSVPPAIKAACIHLGGILRLETSRATRSVSDVGTVVEASPEGQNLISDLIRNYGRVAL